MATSWLTENVSMLLHVLMGSYAQVNNRVELHFHLQNVVMLHRCTSTFPTW